MQANDRGTKKWTSLMLTEHQEALTKLFSEGETVEKPILSEDQTVEMNFKLSRAFTDGLPIEITYFESGRYQKVKGKIAAIHYQAKTLKINELELKLDDVVETEII